MKKVFINGYGSIGSRITSFLKDDPEITVMGIGKYSPDEKVDVAISRGLNVYVPERKLNDFSDYDVSGSIESALDECDLVIDASPGGHGYQNKKNIYESNKIFSKRNISEISLIKKNVLNMNYFFITFIKKYFKLK